MDSDKENLRNTVCANLRSVTQSCKGGVPFSRLERDYRDLLGESIPYRKLGFNSLEALIQSMPDVVSLNRTETGQLIVIGVGNEATAHIVSLVQRQKSSSSRKPVKPKRRNYESLSSRCVYPYSSKPSVSSSRSFNNTSMEFSKSSSSHQSRLHSKPVSHMKRKQEVPPRFLKLSQKNVEKINTYEPEFSTFKPSTYTQFETNISGELLQESASKYKPELVSSSSGKTDSNKKKVPPLVQPPLPVKRTAKEIVEGYAFQQELYVSYNTKPIGQRRKKFISTLTLGDQKFHSFPEEKDTASDAEEEAAKKAVESIEKEAQRQKNYSETPVNTQEQKEVLIQRIEEIISEKPNGIWSTGIEPEYEEKFSETLPSIWLELIKQSSLVEIEKPTGLHVPKGACILHITKSYSGTTTPTSTSSRHSHLEEDSFLLTVEHKTSSISYEDLSVALDNQLAVFVSYVNTTVNIAVRLVDQAEQFAEMSEKMKTYYGTKNMCIPQIKEQKMYAAQLDNDESGYWHRVLVEEFHPGTNKVVCYFVDEGDTINMNVSNLRELDPAFEALTYQALNIRLSGLENEYSKIVKRELLEKYLLAQTLIAKVLNRDENSYEVILYDTSGDDDIDLNQKLLELTIKENLISELPQVGSISISYLTHVTPEGDIYLCFSYLYVKLLNIELEKLKMKFEELCNFSSKQSLYKGKMYVSKFTDDNWYRASIIEINEENPCQVEVFYVDYGNISWVPVTDICELEPISEFLASLPVQAVKCKLSEVPPTGMIWTSEAVLKLKELAPEGEELIVKVDHYTTTNELPKVSIFKRNESSEIISINQTLAFDIQLFSADKSDFHSVISPLVSSGCNIISNIEDRRTSLSLSNNIPDVAISAAFADEQLARKFAGKEMSSPSNLPWILSPDSTNEQLNCTNPPFPEIPDIGKYFDVFIAMAASPSNFVVQPIETSRELDILIQDMQQFYSNEENIFEMHACLLKEKEFYSALYTDGLWYRVQIQNINAGDPIMLTVHFIDFGDFNNVPMSKIQLLWQKFRNLPCQAIKASLADIKPLHDDWDTMECIEFQNIVKEKSFVSQIRNKRADGGFESGEIIVDLCLIDTSSPDKDIFIHEFLIEKGLARPGN